MANCEWSRKANFGRKKFPPTLLVWGREHRPRDSERFQYIVFINYENKIITRVATGESFFFLLMNWLVDFVLTSWTAYSARNAYLYKSGKKAVYQFDFKMNVLHKSKIKCFYLDVVLFIRPWSKFMQAPSNTRGAIHLTRISGNFKITRMNRNSLGTFFVTSLVSSQRPLCFYLKMFESGINV